MSWGLKWSKARDRTRPFLAPVVRGRLSGGAGKAGSGKRQREGQVGAK